MWRPLALVLVGAFLLFFNDQGRELGVSLMIDGDGWFHLVFLFVILFLALLYWGFNNWTQREARESGLALENGVLGVVPAHPLPEKPNAASLTEMSDGSSGCRDCLASARIFSRPSIWRSPPGASRISSGKPVVRLLAWTAPFAIVVFTALVYIFDHYALSERTAGEKSFLARFGSLACSRVFSPSHCHPCFVNFHANSPFGLASCGERSRSACRLSPS